MPVRAGVAPVVPESLGDESAVALPASECSLGICTRSLGFFGSVCRLFVRETGCVAGTEEVDCVRGGGCWMGICCGGGCDGEKPFVCSLDMPATSMDCDRFSCLMNVSLRDGFMLLLPQCAASMDWLSSMGVKMLCLAEACRGRG